jgi:O-antigen/teichoic acid export membrane protein
MKRYIILSVASAVVFVALMLILNALFESIQSFKFYIVTGILFGLLFGAFIFLKERRKKDKNSK